MLLHLLRADARRFRFAILGWLLLEVLNTALQVLLPSLAEYQAVSPATSLLSLAAHILAIVLVVIVVHAHPLVGTDAFWMTRPIPPWALLASKVALLGTLMIGVPVVCEIARMTIDHMPVHDTIVVAAQAVMLDALWLALVMAGAAITDGFARFATLVGAVIASIALWIAASLTYDALRPGDGPPTSAGPGPPPDPTGPVVLLVLTTLAGLVLILVQYRSRSRRLSVPAGLAALVSAFTFASFWPWPFLSPRVIVPDWAQRRSSLRLTADAGTVDFSSEIGRSSSRRLWRQARTKLWIGGLERGWLATVGLVDASIDLGSGGMLPNAAEAHASAVPLEGMTGHPEQTVLRSVLQVQHLPTINLPDGEPATVFVVPEAEFLSHAGSKGTYRGRFRVDLTREEVFGVLALRPGAVFQDGAYRFRIDEVLGEVMGSIRVRARQSDANSWFDRRPISLYAFYLRNNETSEAISSDAWDASAGSMFFGSLNFSWGSSWSGFNSRGTTIGFPGHTLRGQSFSLTHARLERAELVIVRLTREGSVERTLSFPVTLLPGSTGTR